MDNARPQIRTSETSPNGGKTLNGVEILPLNKTNRRNRWNRVLGKEYVHLTLLNSWFVGGEVLRGEVAERKFFGLGKIFGALVTCTSAREGGRN